jgi:hypothetical protein
MKRLTVILIVVTMTIGGATALMAAELPQTPQAEIVVGEILPDAELAQVRGMGPGVELRTTPVTWLTTNSRFTTVSTRVIVPALNAIRSRAQTVLAGAPPILVFSDDPINLRDLHVFSTILIGRGR